MCSLYLSVELQILRHSVCQFLCHRSFVFLMRRLVLFVFAFLPSFRVTCLVTSHLPVSLFFFIKVSSLHQSAFMPLLSGPPLPARLCKNTQFAVLVFVSDRERTYMQ